VRPQQKKLTLHLKRDVEGAIPYDVCAQIFSFVQKWRDGTETLPCILAGNGAPAAPKKTSRPPTRRWSFLSFI
jgi:hypothetical protein